MTILPQPAGPVTALRQLSQRSLDRADARPGRVRSAVPAGERGRRVGTQPFRRGQQTQQPGPASSGRPAADAGDQRHLPGLAAGWRPGRPAPRLLCPPATGLEVVDRHRRPGAAGHADVRRALRVDAGAGARLFGRPDRHRRVPWVGRMCSIRRSPSSLPPMPTRTSATTTRLSPPSAPDVSPPTAACDLRTRAPAVTGGGACPTSISRRHPPRPTPSHDRSPGPWCHPTRSQLPCGRVARRTPGRRRHDPALPQRQHPRSLTNLPESPRFEMRLTPPLAALSLCNGA